MSFVSLGLRGLPLSAPKPLRSTRRPLPLGNYGGIPGTGDLIDPIAITLSYHQQTKHHLDRYARSLGYLDWATQPDPFRTFKGAKRIELPLAADGLNTPYADLFTPFAVPARPLDLRSIAILFELALGLSAWKEFRGNRWALRCNPSSGNLHPTEGYAILPPLPRLRGRRLSLCQPRSLPGTALLSGGGRGGRIGPGVAGGLLPGGAVVDPLAGGVEIWRAGLSLLPARRRPRHRHGALRGGCPGLVGAAARFALRMTMSPPCLGLDRAADFAGVDPHDREHPDALILVSRRPVSAPPRALPVEAIRAGHWAGQANQLSPSHVDWDVIDDVAKATWKPATDLARTRRATPRCRRCPPPAAPRPRR